MLYTHCYMISAIKNKSMYPTHFTCYIYILPKQFHVLWTEYDTNRCFYSTINLCNKINIQTSMHSYIIVLIVLVYS